MNLKQKFVAILLGVACIFAFGQESTGTLTTTTFTIYDFNSAPIVNPDKGISAYIATNDLISEGFNTCCVSYYQNTFGSGVALCSFNLQAFISSNLSTTYLNQYDAALANVKAHGLQCEMQHSYDDFSGSGVDASMSQIVAHINQLGPIWKKYADVIPFAKASFIGAYGEEWGSKSGNSCTYDNTTASGVTISNCTSDPNAPAVLANRLLWRNALIANYPPTTLVGVRYPTEISYWFPNVLTQSQAWNGSTQARITARNDCPMAGSILTGSGADDYGGWYQEYGQSASVASLEAYIGQLNSFLGYLGEFSGSCTPTITDCTSARTYMSYFHAINFKLVVNGSGPNFTGDGAPYANGWYNGGCLNEIANRMGYFLSLDSVSHQSTANRGQSITVSIFLHNNGFARISTPRKVNVNVCLVASPNTCYTGVADGDLRLLPSQTTTPSKVQAHITIPSGATTGAYQIRLSVPSSFPADINFRPYMIHFANVNGSGTQAWNDTGGYMVTGTTLTVN